MLPALQQPLLPVQQGSPIPGGQRIAAGRSSSQQASPAKELVAAMQQGDVEGALRVASWACLRSLPVLLLSALGLLMAAVGLAALLLPQQSVPVVLQHARLRHSSPRQRTFFEELTREEQQQLVVKPPPSKPRPLRKWRQQPSREELLDALIFPEAAQQLAQQDQEQHTNEPNQRQHQNQHQLANEQPASKGSGVSNGSEVWNIHDVAKVPPLFGS